MTLGGEHGREGLLGACEGHREGVERLTVRAMSFSMSCAMAPEVFSISPTPIPRSTWGALVNWMSS